MKFEPGDYVFFTINRIDFYGCLIKAEGTNNKYWHIQDVEDDNVLFVHESHLVLVFRPSPTDAGYAEYCEIMGLENMD